ncbi:hypothetical protein [Flagellimonas nanhaiensis]|nr:hypothetical protein [Allomuricauda nanhaiensis]
MKYRYLIFSLFLITTLSCGNPYSRAINELKNTEFKNDSELLTAKKAIGFIKENQLDSLKSMFPEKIIATATDSIWRDIMEKGQKAISESKFPSDSLVQISNTINILEDKKQIFAKLSFPFTDEKDSSQFINIITSENQLYGLNVGDYPFGRRIIEPEHSEPHLSYHNIVYDSINWFRIWYGSGFKKNDFGDSYGYYAVSGDKEKLDKLEIRPILTEIFELINSAKIDSTDFNYLRPKRNGDSEYIYLRFKMLNEPYKDFGEFTIYYILEEENGKPEELSDFITIKHSKKSRYLYNKSNNLKLVEKLKELTYKDYGRHQETRWH